MSQTCILRMLMVNGCDNRVAICVFVAQKLPRCGHLRWSGQGFDPGDDEPFLQLCPLGRQGAFHGSLDATGPLGRGGWIERFARIIGRPTAPFRLGGLDAAAGSPVDRDQETSVLLDPIVGWGPRVVALG